MTRSGPRGEANATTTCGAKRDALTGRQRRHCRRRPAARQAARDQLQRARSRACKRLFGAAKAGHTGTLDPLATGCSRSCFGEATKFSQSLCWMPTKATRPAFGSGVTTTTGDLEGDVIARAPVARSSRARRAVLARFRGEIEQVPPMYSALKQDGKPLYEYARAGIDRAAGRRAA